ncbi:MAG: DUF2271 domain-containing protein [Candidatus Krumholzibacteria bacterium]|nr:DUF2271 domain-containing protein [Candidatus Krumholzibacteria bacterium]
MKWLGITRTTRFITSFTVFFTCTLLAVMVAVLSVPIEAADGTSLEEAVKLGESGELGKAMTALESIIEAEPENSDALAYLGLYTGMSAGSTKDYMEAGRLTMESFGLLDKAIALDENNSLAYLFRGIMGVNVPGFLGRLDGGIKDLEKAAQFYSTGSSKESMTALITALSTLSDGYAKKGDIAGQRKALESIVKTIPGSEKAAKAEKALSGLPAVETKPEKTPDILVPSEKDAQDISVLKKKAADNPKDATTLLELGKTLYSKEDYSGAAEVLKLFVELDDTDPEAWKMLSFSVAMAAEIGYDENIYEDTDYRSRLALESITFMDRAVALSPEDLELRLQRGIFGIMFPFFLGKFEQGVEDLKMVEASEVPESMKAEALYYLGEAKQREALRYWIRISKEFKGTDAEKMVYETMRPKVARLDLEEQETPFVKIDFILGYQDELPPQTAIWIEDGDGKYIATIYVSGFAGYVKENQVTLPAWARGSGFENVDAVTGASIDIGHHIYTWDLKDHNGEKVRKGKYIIIVETSHWPSMKYQIVKSPISVRKKENNNIVQEGDFIPWLEVSYIDK